MIPFIIGGLIAGAVIAVLMLKYKDILNWFHNRVPLDKDHVGIVLKKKLANGEAKVLKVGFNTETNEVEEHELNQAKELDDELESKPNSFVVDSETFA